MAPSGKGSSGHWASKKSTLSTGFRFISFRQTPASMLSLVRSSGRDSSRSRVSSAGVPPRPASPVQPLRLHANNLRPSIRLQPRRSDDHDLARARRWAMFDQLIAYETNYFRTLVLLSQDCYDELMKIETVVPQTTVHQIFAYLPELRVLHWQFRKWLADGARHWNVREMAGWIINALLEQPALLSAYSRFVANYDRAVLLIQSQMRRPGGAFYRFIEERLRHIEPRLSFEDVFMRPIQRMIHLEQQIGELLQATPNTHPDFPMLRQCSQRVRHIVSQLDLLEGHVRSLRTVLGPDFPEFIPSSLPAHRWRQVELLHCEDLSHTVVTRQGVRRQKIGRLFLLTDRIVYAEVRGVNSTAGSRFETRLRLRWVLPLAAVEMYGVSPRGAKRAHQGPATDAFMDMRHVMIDTSIVTDIRSKFELLRRSFGELGETTVDSMIAQCGVEMTRIDQEARIADECYQSSELLVTTRHDASPAGRRKSYLLRFPNPAAKQRWYGNTRLAQRALRNPSLSSVLWTDIKQLCVTNEPVFVDRLSPGFPSSSKLACWCYFAPNLAAPLYSQMPLTGWLANRHMLWVCTHREGDTVVTIYTHDMLSNTLLPRTEFHLEDALIACAVHVPHGAIVPEDENSADTIWLGHMNELLVYSTAHPLVDKQLACISISSNATHLLYRAQRVYVGLSSGQVLIFHSGATTWNLNLPMVVEASVCPVAGLLAVGGNVCVAAGTSVAVIDGRGDWLRRKLKNEDLHPFLKPIRCMVHTVHGMWLVRYRSSLISLHRVSPFQHVLDIDVSGPVSRIASVFRQGITPGSIYVTAIAVVDDTMWIGTSIGVTLLVALPAHRYAPAITDFLYGVKQGHLGEVNMMLPLVLRSDAEPSGDDGEDGQVGYDFPDSDDDDDDDYDSYYDNDTDSHDSSQHSDQHSDSSGTIYDNVCTSDSESESTGGPSTSTGTLPKPQPKPSTSGIRRPEPTTTEQRHESSSVLVLAGGTGYLNWHKLDYYSNSQVLAEPDFPDDYYDQPHIIVWERRLNNPLHRFA